MRDPGSRGQSNWATFREYFVLGAIVGMIHSLFTDPRGCACCGCVLVLLVVFVVLVGAMFASAWPWIGLAVLVFLGGRWLLKYLEERRGG